MTFQTSLTDAAAAAAAVAAAAAAAADDDDDDDDDDGVLRMSKLSTVTNDMLLSVTTAVLQRVQLHIPDTATQHLGYTSILHPSSTSPLYLCLSVCLSVCVHVCVCRPVLFQSSECIADSDVIGDVIPYSTALHLLYARGHPDIKPPYQVAVYQLCVCVCVRCSVHEIPTR